MLSVFEKLDFRELRNKAGKNMNLTIHRQQDTVSLLEESRSAERTCELDELLRIENVLFKCLGKIKYIDQYTNCVKLKEKANKILKNYFIHHKIIFLSQILYKYNNSTINTYRNIENHIYKLKQEYILLIARQHGYEGNHFNKARTFLSSLKEGLSILVHNRFIPREYIVYRIQGPYNLDPEATYRNLSLFLNSDHIKAVDLKQKLEKHLIQLLKSSPTFPSQQIERIKQIRALVELGILQGVRNTKVLVGLYNLVICEKQHNNLVTLSHMLMRGANPDVANTLGYTPLHLASLCEDTRSIQRLLEYNALPDEQDEEGRTPLFIAVTLGDLKSVELLLDNGANPDVGTHANESPIQKAKAMKHHDIEALLHEYHAKE